jgi:hypothetical protein
MDYPISSFSTILKALPSSITVLNIINVEFKEEEFRLLFSHLSRLSLSQFALTNCSIEGEVGLMVDSILSQFLKHSSIECLMLNRSFLGGSLSELGMLANSIGDMQQVYFDIVNYSLVVESGHF